MTAFTIMQMSMQEEDHLYLIIHLMVKELLF